MVWVMIGIFTAMALNFTYIFFLGRFFNELERNDPEARRSIGSPGIKKMASSRAPSGSFYAFLGVLREKAGVLHINPAATMAWVWLRVAASITALIVLGMVGTMLLLF
ncbi:MAG: hypothetical protein RI942_1666 [Pseudomonadota bacterium]